MSESVNPGEYEFEAVHGLPEVLPEQEPLLWQGSPDWRSLARRAFHVRKVAVYFALLGVWRLAAGIAEGEALAPIAFSLAGLAGLALLAVALLSGMAWMHARATVYTLTSRRVVIRHGVALTMAVNLPFGVIRSAALRAHADGSGDIPLQVEGAERIGWVLLWPHVRPWHFGRHVQPMLRCVPDAAEVAELLVQAVGGSRAAAPVHAHETPVRRAGPASVATAVS